MTAPTEPTTTPAAEQPPAQVSAPPVPTPAQVFPPQQAAPAPSGTAPSGTAPSGTAPSGTAPSGTAPSGTAPGEHGFPENTPLAQMTDGQQAAYWRYHARKHETRANSMADYDDLKAKAARLAEIEAANMTDTQRAVAEAEQRGRAAALAEAGSSIVESMIRAALHGRRSADEINDLFIGLDRKSFLRADGIGVDADKVSRYVNVVAPAVAPAAAPAAPAATSPTAVTPVTGGQRQTPDMGQGNRTAPPSGGLAAGAERAKARLARRQGPPPITGRQ